MKHLKCNRAIWLAVVVFIIPTTALALAKVTALAGPGARPMTQDSPIQTSSLRLNVYPPLVYSSINPAGEAPPVNPTPSTNEIPTRELTPIPDQRTASVQAQDHCGTISANETWDAGQVHRITCDVTVSAGVTLTLPAGTVIKFLYEAEANTGCSGSPGKRRFIVNGVLDFQGTTGSPVVFTSDRDDTYGGDTNNDADATVPAAGDWGYIQINNSTNAIHHAVLRYGGLRDDDATCYYRSWQNHMLWVNTTVLTVHHALFEYSYGDGIYISRDGTNPMVAIQYCEFRRNNGAAVGVQ